MSKKILILFITIFSSSVATAAHYFTLCYVNHSDKKVGYNNAGYEHKWTDRGECVGSGFLQPLETKCFRNIKDETIVSTDMITFTIDSQWFGIVNPWHTQPYIVSGYATAKKGGKLLVNTKNGRENYKVYINIMPDKSFILSNDEDLSDKSQIITPRKHK